MKIRYILSTVFAVCCSLALQAQKDTALVREMLLEKEYNPTIMTATRLNFLPEIKEPQLRKIAPEYSNYASPFNTKPQIVQIDSEPFYTDISESDKRGYLKAGIATNLNLNGDLGYQILRTQETQFDIYASHRSANSSMTYLQESSEKQKMKMNDTWGALSFRHKYNSLSLFAGLKYTHSSFNYYGYPLIPERALLLPALNRNVNQVNNIFDVSAGVKSDGTDDWNYYAKFNYISFDQEFSTSKELLGPKESIGKLDWDVSYRFSGDNKYGIAGYVYGMFYDYLQPKEGLRYYNGYKDHVRIVGNPYVDFLDLSWKVHLGAKIYTTFGYGDVFAIAPDLGFFIYPTEDSELYLTTTGGLNSNSNYTVYQTNRYAGPQNRIADTRTDLDAVLGYKMNIDRNFWFNLYAGYQIDKGAHFFRAEYPNPSSFMSAIAGNVAIADTMNANLFKIGVHTKYKIQDAFEIGLQAQYNMWDVDNYDYQGPVASKAWYKPVFECDLTAGYRFTAIPLRLDLLYHLETGRNALVCIPTEEEYTVKMDNINEINVTATYTINKTFSVYGILNNLLSQNYDIMYGYPAQGVNFMLGGSIKF